MEKKIRIKIFLVQHKRPSLFFANSASIVAECSFTLNSIDSFQNRLIEMAGQWMAHRHKGILKNVKRLFFDMDAPVGSLRLYASYLSDEEAMGSQPPTSLYSLNKWLMIRRHASNLLFAGYLNVASDDHDWKRM